MSTKIKQLFKDLSEENAVELRDILADGSWGHTAVADWIKGMGYSISEAGVRRWRNEHGWTKSTPMAAVETEDGEPYIQRQTREVGDYRQFDNDDQPMHFIIPDTQIEPGDPTDMMRWAGQYLVDHFGASRRSCASATMRSRSLATWERTLDCVERCRPTTSPMPRPAGMSSPSLR